MSDTQNEYEEPGANYPDADGKADAQDRSGVDASGNLGRPESRATDDAQGSPDAAEQDAAPKDDPADRTAPPQPGTQNEPAQDVHPTTNQERLDGILIQVRADVAGQDAGVVEKALRSRLEDVGIDVDESEIAALVQRIAG